MVQAHAYWRLKGLAVDLVIWNEDRGGYRQVLQDQILGLIAAGVEANVIDRPGGIFVRRVEQISEEDRILMQSVARAIVTDRRGSLEEQVAHRVAAEPRVPRLEARARTTRRRGDPAASRGRADPFQRLGGFTADGTEYVITTLAGETTPLPWANVIANPEFGTMVSESGGRVHVERECARVSPHAVERDAVGDASGEAMYLRDEETGHFWSPTPLPRRGAGAYVTRHGFGYSVFEHREDGIESELTVYVAIDAPVKFAALRVRNASGRPRRLSAMGYLEWVLGDVRPKTAMHVITEIEAKSGALTARNAYNSEFPERTAFFDVDDPARSMSGDRTEVLGRNGTLRNPAAMARARLSGKVGAALDPCAAIQVPVDLGDGESRDIVFRWAWAGTRSTPRISCNASGVWRPPAPRSKACARIGSEPSVPCRCARPILRSTCSPTAGSSTRRSPAAFSRARATTNRAGRSASATSSRTRWRWCTPSRCCCARTCCAAPGASSSRATCSIGGIRRAGAACARAARTTTCGCRSPPRAT
jgi:cellobiose phosphorylase